MLARLLDEARPDMLKRDAERKILVQTRSAKTVDAIRISMDILDSGTTIPV